ncbi:MAG: LysR family transcriptional regulator, partial [Planctomycetia bacterium]|nr:LysR family transcriptional regulator [Planctomycetia bacterium]
MELRVLKYFLEVAREGSITAASLSLQVTQPTLSRQLKDLEEELGQKLFIRGSHHITLTPEGMLLRKRAGEIMAIVEKTEDEFYSLGESISGTIHIGGGESSAMRAVAEVFREMREEYPGIHYDLYSGNAEDVMDRLDKGVIDFGVIIQPVDISKYNSVSLPDKDVWGIVLRKD